MTSKDVANESADARSGELTNRRFTATWQRQAAALAGHTGDEPTARSLARHVDPSVRATAYAALVRMGSATAEDIHTALADPSAIVRRRACALAIEFIEVDIRPRLTDESNAVIEQAAWALGERGGDANNAVAALIEIVRSHEDALCRESAVAALGAIGDEAGLPAILHATKDKPPIRRRAVIALAPFDGPEVDAAFERAKADRDWQVRQAAEDMTD